MAYDVDWDIKRVNRLRKETKKDNETEYEWMVRWENQRFEKVVHGDYEENEEDIEDKRAMDSIFGQKFSYKK